MPQWDDLHLAGDANPSRPKPTTTPPPDATLTLGALQLSLGITSPPSAAMACVMAALSSVNAGTLTCAGCSSSLHSSSSASCSPRVGICNTPEASSQQPAHVQRQPSSSPYCNPPKP